MVTSATGSLWRRIICKYAQTIQRRQLGERAIFNCIDIVVTQCPENGSTDPFGACTQQLAIRTGRRGMAIL